MKQNNERHEKHHHQKTTLEKRKMEMDIHGNNPSKASPPFFSITQMSKSPHVLKLKLIYIHWTMSP